MSRWHTALNRLFKGLLAIWLVVLMSGAPLPALPQLGATSKRIETTERFPCEACPCGCGTADYCWRSCCCHTLQQRLAWAVKNEVRPPESALKEAVSQGIDVSHWGIESTSKRCLITYKLPKVATCEETKSLPPCCAARLKNSRVKANRVKAGQETKQEEQAVKKKAPPGVVLLNALACQGLLEQWLTIGAGPLPPIVTWTPSFKLESAPAETAILYTNWPTLLVPPPPEC